MKGQSTDESHVFVCARCDEQIRVDNDVRRIILAEGCVICGEDATPSAFDIIR